MIETRLNRADVDGIGTELCALAGDIAAATARFLTLLAQFDAHSGWNGPGLHSCAHWLSWKCGISLHTGREYVRVAKALVGLPHLRESFEKGQLSYSKIRALTRVTTADNEMQMLRMAREAPAAQIDRLTAGLRTATADKSTNPRKATERQRVRWRWDADTGELVITGRLASHDGATLLAALTAAEQARVRTTQTDPAVAAKSPGDIGPALVALAQIGARGGGESPQQGASPEVVYFREQGSVHSADGPALPDHDAEEVLCNSSVRPAESKDGCVLNFGRRRRIVSSKQMLALKFRDRCCSTPGCGRTRFLHAHHVQFWGRGGSTDLDNLTLLCGTCHRALHRGEFSVNALGRQRFEFRYANGDVIDPSPPMVGFADSLLRGDLPRDAIVPRWDGEPLHLDHAVSVILDSWAA